MSREVRVDAVGQALQLQRIRSPAIPEEAGYYICWLRCSSAPVVVYWSGQERCWRRGTQKVEVTSFAGPLP